MYLIVGSASGSTVGCVCAIALMTEVLSEPVFPKASFIVADYNEESAKVLDTNRRGGYIY